MSKSYLHTPQVIDRQKFLFLLSTNIWMLAMRYNDNFMMNLVSLLYIDRGVTRGVGRAQREMTPSASGGQRWLLSPVLRDRRRETILLRHTLEEGMTATAGSCVSKTLKAKIITQESELQQNYSILGATDNTWFRGRAVVSGCGFTRLVWTTLSVPARMIIFLHVYSQRHSRLFPLEYTSMILTDSEQFWTEIH